MADLGRSKPTSLGLSTIRHSMLRDKLSELGVTRKYGDARSAHR
jgi:hypothetical protein